MTQRQRTQTHWDVYRQGSQTFAERVTLPDAVEPRTGDAVPLALSPPVWRIVAWEPAGEEEGASVYRVWVLRTSS